MSRFKNLSKLLRQKDNTSVGTCLRWSPENGPVKGASQHGAGDRCHAQWCMCASFTQEADPTIVREEKPVGVDDRHMETQIVRFGTHDGRVAHSAHLRKLHSVRFGTHDVSRTVLIYESCTLHHAIFAWVAVILQSIS